ncbi:MAG TPA: PIN domain-containing protein [Anaerolineae bacterium]|nr:PIN domain-containing protein [Anaerolineae bacterium]
MATYLLDTGLVLRHLRGQSRTVQLLRSLGKESRLAVASVTRLEVHAGMQPEERYATQKLLARLATLDMDREIADRAGDLIAASKRAGRALSVPDAIIAATAIDHHLTLVTLNQGDFQSIAGLRLYVLDDMV